MNVEHAAPLRERRRTKPLLARALGWLLLLAPLGSQAAEPPSTVFQPPGMWIWDNWFARDEGGRWHAFYLQLPKAVGMERRWKNNDLYKHVGHAISANLRDWQDAGPALCALPGTWNDRHIATGSIIRHADQWWMFFTGRGHAGDGVGLALSTDLMTWKTEPQPVWSLIDTFATDGAAPAESAWEGKPQKWAGISDPYIHPEAVDGWFYLVLCSRILGAPIESSGCLTLLRSRDLRQWENAGIISWPQCFERMETPQLWRRGGRWYLSFGGVLNTAWAQGQQQAFPPAVRGQPSHQNYYFMVSDFLAPARVEDLHFLDVPAGNYIMKVLPGTDGAGDDIALFTSKEKEPRGSCLSPPYRVKYGPEGLLEILPLMRP